MFSDSLSILSVLLFNIAFSEWLSTKPFFKHLGTGLLVILLTAVVANLGIIPASTPSTPIYEGIFQYIAPLSIFLMLLNVNLNSLKKAGKPMLIMFAVGAIATSIGAFIAIWAINGKAQIGEFSHAIGGMFTATYIGGSINFNAVAMHYGVSQQGGLFSAATVADNIISAIWVVATLVIPQVLNRFYPRAKPAIMKEQDVIDTEIYTNDTEKVNPFDISILLMLGFVGISLSKWINSLIPQIPVIILITILATVLAQIPAINRLKGHRLFGLLCVYLFLGVIGAYCDIPALIKDGHLALILMTLVTVLVSIHGLIIFGIGALFKVDWDIVSIASQANVGGTATAMALSRSLNRNDLTLPGILVGALGNATGTYIGILMAELLRSSICQ